MFVCSFVFEFQLGLSDDDKKQYDEVVKTFLTLTFVRQPTSFMNVPNLRLSFNNLVNLLTNLYVLCTRLRSTAILEQKRTLGFVTALLPTCEIAV